MTPRGRETADELPYAERENTRTSPLGISLERVILPVRQSARIESTSDEAEDSVIIRVMTRVRGIGFEFSADKWLMKVSLNRI